MKEIEFRQKLTDLSKLIRIEAGFSQDQMAIMLGISKKSLVETEKGRRLLSWNEAVTLAVVFRHSKVLQNEFGGEVSDMIEAIAFSDLKAVHPKTMGGKVWWNDLENRNGFRLQQNILSGHYRILDPQNERLMSSFDYEEAMSLFEHLEV